VLEAAWVKPTLSYVCDYFLAGSAGLAAGAAGVTGAEIAGLAAGAGAFDGFSV